MSLEARMDAMPCRGRKSAEVSSCHNNRQTLPLLKRPLRKALQKMWDSLTSFPKTLERIWCEQEDGPVGSLFSACLLICF